MEGCTGIVFENMYRETAERAIREFNFEWKHLPDYRLEIVELEAVTPPSFIITPSILRTELPPELCDELTRIDIEHQTEDATDRAGIPGNDAMRLGIMHKIAEFIHAPYMERTSTYNLVIKKDVMQPLHLIWKLLCRAYPDGTSPYTTVPLQVVTFATKKETTTDVAIQEQPAISL